MSGSRTERKEFGVEEITQVWLEELEIIDRQRADLAAEGMKFLHHQVGCIWNKERVRLEVEGESIKPSCPLIARIKLPHVAVPQEIVDILSSDNSNDRGSRLVKTTGECAVKIYNPELGLRLQFDKDGRRVEVHNISPAQTAKPPAIDVWPLNDSVKDKLADPIRLLAKIIRVFPHIASLDYYQSTS